MMTICGAVNFSIMPLPLPKLVSRVMNNNNASLFQGADQVKLVPAAIMNRANRRPCTNPCSLRYVVVRAAPEMMSEKVEKSVEEAKEVCSDDPKSGECVAAWDEVEELSAAASHNRDREKETYLDPLEKYCKDNPETDECRIYDN